MKTLSEMLADWVIRTERLDLRDLLRAPSPSLQFRKVKCSAIISKDLLFSASDPCKQKDGVPRFMSIERERERERDDWRSSCGVRMAKASMCERGRRHPRPWEEEGGGPMPVASWETVHPRFSQYREWLGGIISRCEANKSVAHMSAPPPLGQAEGNKVHPWADGGPPSAGYERRSGPSAFISHT